MCFYCDDRHEPIKIALAGVSVLDRSLFENPPLNYARYGLYPRDILPPHKGYEKTAETEVCPFCNTNIWERDREKIKQEIKEYLDEFCSDKSGYLRKYHGSEDEPLYELTTHAAKAMEFLQSLEQREFVGSRSKFNVIFELLEDLEFETNYSDEQRIHTLEEEKRKLDEKIKKIKKKEDLRFDSSRIKEHFMLLEETARKLKYDFSEIEYNFRELNNIAMEQITTREDTKSEVLDTIFDIENSIRNQDQGKSFFAFWQLLTDPNRSEKLSDMLDNLYENEVIQEFDREGRLKSLKYELLQSGRKVSNVSSKLIDQLRRYIDDRVWFENKRILELCKKIEKKALEIKTTPPKEKNFIKLQGSKAQIKSPFSNSLYEVKKNKKLRSQIEEKVIEIDLDSFYNQFFIDEELLKHNIKYMLQRQVQCSLVDIIKQFGVKKGIAELIGYLSIAKNSDSARVDSEQKSTIKIEDMNGSIKEILIPQIMFVRPT